MLSFNDLLTYSLNENRKQMNSEVAGSNAVRRR